MSVIKSVGCSDSEILSNILTLYNLDQFDVDPCYSVGNFYKTIPQPKYKFDLNPQVEGVQQADSRSLPLEDISVHSIVFDPPFMFGTHGQTKNNIMNKRFTMFDTWDELADMYIKSLDEFYRILDKGGYVFFKCQDYTDSRTVMTHCFVWEWANRSGFYAKDLFILLAKQRIYNPRLKQRHARKFHSYYWVFQK